MTFGHAEKIDGIQNISFTHPFLPYNAIYTINGFQLAGFMVSVISNF